MGAQPHIVVLAGPNGAGKSTTAPALLRGQLGVDEFVNADTIALGLSAFAPERAAIDAGRVMLRRLDRLASQQRSFAFETTLASRSFAPRIVRWAKIGYRVHLVFLWLPNAEFAVQRVHERVRLGGHDVPMDTVRRRYARGLRNFSSLYRELATTWRFYDNSKAHPRLIARGEGGRHVKISDEPLWSAIMELPHET